jgi:hypothetical protein
MGKREDSDEVPRDTEVAKEENGKIKQIRQ